MVDMSPTPTMDTGTSMPAQPMPPGMQQQQQNPQTAALLKAIMGNAMQQQQQMAGQQAAMGQPSSMGAGMGASNPIASQPTPMPPVDPASMTGGMGGIPNPSTIPGSVGAGIPPSPMPMAQGFSTAGTDPVANALMSPIPGAPNGG